MEEGHREREADGEEVVCLINLVNSAGTIQITHDFYSAYIEILIQVIKCVRSCFNKSKFKSLLAWRIFFLLQAPQNY